MDSREKRAMCNSNDSKGAKSGKIRDFEQGARIKAGRGEPIEISPLSQAAGVTKEMTRYHQRPTPAVFLRWLNASVRGLPIPPSTTGRTRSRNCSSNSMSSRRRQRRCPPSKRLPQSRLPMLKKRMCSLLRCHQQRQRKP